MDPTKKLLIIQLVGGNDGLNTLVPFENDIYYNLRPSLNISKNKTLPITSLLGFNSSLNYFHELYNSGYLSIINNVGYPNSSRSHFKSMDIWHSANPEVTSQRTGWVGRYLDAYYHEFEHNLGAIEIHVLSSLLMQGVDKKGVALEDFKSLRDKLNSSVYQNMVSRIDELGTDAHDNLKHVYHILSEGTSGIETIYKNFRRLRPKTQFAKRGLSSKLKVISDLILGGAETQIFSVSHGSFDTHARQNRLHTRLLTGLDKGIEHFVKAMLKYDKLDDVCILIFSEFGRRVKENASKGTDHGTANNVYVISNQLATNGVYNKLHDLSKLDDGDVPYEIDFRRIYATLIDDWLQADSQEILGERFQTLPLFNSINA